MASPTGSDVDAPTNNNQSPTTQSNPPPANLPPARDDWLTGGVSDFAALGGKSKQQLAEAAAAAKAAHDAQHSISARELNPDMAAQRDGGAAGAPPLPAGGPAMVGDGGASWRMKALKRAQQQVREEGGSVRHIVEERWGSLATLTDDLSKSKIAHGM